MAKILLQQLEILHKQLIEMKIWKQRIESNKDGDRPERMSFILTS